MTKNKTIAPLLVRPGVAFLAAAAALPAFAQQQSQTPPTNPGATPPANPFPKSEPPTKAGDVGKTAPRNTPGRADVVELPSPLSLAQAIELSLRLQPNIAVAVANRQGAEQRVKQAQTNYYPRVTPTYQYNTTYTYGPSTRFVQSTNTNTGTGGNGTGGTGIGGTGIGGTGTGGTGTGGTGTGGTGTGTGGTGTGGTGTGGTGTGTTTNDAAGQTRQVTGQNGGFVTTNNGSNNTTRQANLAVSYNLYDSGSRELQARQARQSLRGAGYSEQDTRQGTIANVADAYFNALRTAALVRVAEANVARAQNTLDVVRAQVEAGVSARKDTFQAEADLLNAQVTLLRNQNDAAVAQAQLKNTIGVVGGQSLTLADFPAPTETTPLTAALTPQGSSNPSAPSATVSADVGEAINQFSDVAYRARPDLAQAQTNVEVSQTSVSLSKVGAGLQISANAFLNNRISTDRFDRSIGNDRSVAVGVSYPLFDAGNARSQVNEARASERASDARLVSLRQQVAVEVEQAYRTLAQSRASIPAALAAQRAAQINYDAALESRREGVGSIVEVITAQTQLVQAQQSYIQAIYDFYGADARLARAVGQAERIAQTGASAQTNPNAPATPAVTPPPVVTPPVNPPVAPPATPPVVTPP